MHSRLKIEDAIKIENAIKIGILKDANRGTLVNQKSIIFYVKIFIYFCTIEIWHIPEMFVELVFIKLRVLKEQKVTYFWYTSLNQLNFISSAVYKSPFCVSV